MTERTQLLFSHEVALSIIFGHRPCPRELTFHSNSFFVGNLKVNPYDIVMTEDPEWVELEENT